MALTMTTSRCFLMAKVPAWLSQNTLRTSAFANRSIGLLEENTLSSKKVRTVYIVKVWVEMPLENLSGKVMINRLRLSFVVLFVLLNDTMCKWV